MTANYRREEDGRVTVFHEDGKGSQPVRFVHGTPVNRAGHLGTLADGGVVCTTVGPSGLVTLYEIGHDDVARVLSKDEFVRRALPGVAWS